VKVLVLGSDSSIGHEVCQLMSSQQTISCVGLTKADAELVDGEMVRHKPDFVINCYTLGLAYINAVDAKQVLWIEKLMAAVSSVGAAMVHISSSQIFDGSKKTPYLETDEINAISDIGKKLYQIERIVQQSSAPTFVLRSGWVFGSRQGGFLDRLLAHVESGDEIRFQSSLGVAPTPAEDLARVVNTVVWQLYYGADCWGAYHYTGSEVTTSMGFTDTLIALASQYGEVDLDGVQLIEVDDFSGPEIAQYPLLDCEKILEAFGVKQRTWRSALTAVIKKRYQNRSDSAE
jgi:dTDP-4-dehydrorhamnose reductase